MFVSVTIFDRWVDSEQTTRLTHRAPKEGINVSPPLTGLILNAVVGRTHTF
jgi:hypothetical protein